MAWMLLLLLPLLLLLHCLLAAASSSHFTEKSEALGACRGLERSRLQASGRFYDAKVEGG